MKDSNYKNRDFYKGKKVFLTGDTGFKGAWFITILNYFGADVLGYSLEPEPGCLFEKIHGENLIHHVTGDIRDYDNLKKEIEVFNPEIVFHLAAYGFITECYQNPINAYSTNLIGTVNLLNILRNCNSVKSIVLISTDKVYQNKGDGAIYKESDLLGGLSPYSGSKTCMEYAINDFDVTYYSDRDNTGIATIRASNVLAGGDHIKSRLIPGILDAISCGSPVEIRNPNQTRPWQSVFDALDGYMTIGRLIYDTPKKYSGKWNVGPTLDGIKTVQCIYDMMKRSFECLSEENASLSYIKESATLGLDISKMVENTDWEPRLSFEKIIYQIVDFYKGECSGEDVRSLCIKQIKEYYEA